MARMAILAAFAVVLATAASGNDAQGEPIYVPSPVLEFTPDGGFSPRALSRSTPTPIALTVGARVSTGDGSHPPPLRELAIDLDKNIVIDLKGYPACHFSRIQIDSPMTPEEECRAALVGKGIAHFEIAFPEAQSKQIRSSVQIFNGTRRNGIRTLYLATYITLPVPAWIIVTAHIRKIGDGRYGSEAILTFPKIAGEGAITSLDLRIKKQLPLYGRRFSPIRAKCADGKLQFRDTATFSSSETAQTSDELVRPCDSR